MEGRRQVAWPGRLIGVGPAAEQLHRLGLGRGGEGHVGDAAAAGAGGHVGGEQVVDRHLAAIGQVGQVGSGEHLAQLEGGVAGLGAVGLIGDHREALAAGGGELLHFFDEGREGLDGADHDFLVAGEGRGQLLALDPLLGGDRGHHPLAPLEVLQGFLQLGIDHAAVAHHQHRVEELAVVGVVQVGEQVGAPADRGGFARAGGVLDQVAPAGAFFQHGLEQQAGHGQLVVAGEDDPADLLFLVALGDAVAAEDLQPAVALPHLFPEVGGAVPLDHRVARAAVRPSGVAAAVEGQELGAGPLQAGGDLHLAVAHGEVHQGAAGEGEQRFGWLPGCPGMPVGFVLPDGVGDRLGVVGLELSGGHRNAIEQKNEIEAVLVAAGVAHLAHHAQAVGVVAGQDLWIEPEGRLELGELECLGQTEYLHAVAEQIKGAHLIKLLAHALQQGGFRFAAVVFLQHLPCLRLGLLHPGDQIGRVEGELAVVIGGGAVLVEPAVGAEVLADLALEGDFVADAHCTWQLRPCRAMRAG